MLCAGIIVLWLCRRVVVTPTLLREALSALPNTPISLNTMYDASEVLTHIWDEIIRASRKGPGQGNIIDWHFGIRYHEQVRLRY